MFVIEQILGIKSWTDIANLESRLLLILHYYAGLIVYNSQLFECIKWIADVDPASNAFPSKDNNVLQAWFESLMLDGVIAAVGTELEKEQQDQIVAWRKNAVLPAPFFSTWEVAGLYK